MADRIDQLIEKLKTTDRGVIRASMVDELGQSRDPRALRSLVEALNDGETLVRWNAIKGIGNFGEDAARLLLNMLNTDDKYMRRNIVQALGEIGGDIVTDELIRRLMFDESDTNVLVEIIRALHKLAPDRAVEPLITVLQSKDWEMRWRSIHTLGKIGNPRAIEPLLEIMNDQDPDIRWAANAAIENIKAAELSRTEETSEQQAERKAIPSIPDKPRRPASSSKELSLSTSSTPGKVIVNVDGDLNADNVSNFTGFVDGIISISQDSMIINLSKCSFIDSFALGALNNIRKKLKARKSTLSLTGMAPQIKRVFVATKLDALFEIK